MDQRENQSKLSCDISIDSLEDDFKQKTSIASGKSEANVDTILVPFYEKDVLIKVSKDKPKGNGESRSRSRAKKDASNSSYLINKMKPKNSYLEMFRRQLEFHKKAEKKPKALEKETEEIRSISPQYGDTERDSMSEIIKEPDPEYFDTESYNEIYYEKLMAEELEQYMNAYPTGDENGISAQDLLLENLKSVSEVSHAQHQKRRKTIPALPMCNVKLGGLGPDMEQIKPRLERARSLQRYSEKVRMENRLRIYKKSVETENIMKLKKESETKQRSFRTELKKDQTNVNASYLVNKSSPAQPKQQLLNKLYGKVKSADIKKHENAKGEQVRSASSRVNNEEKQRIIKKQHGNEPNKRFSAKDKRCPEPVNVKARAKSSSRSQAMNTEKVTDMPPVQINFMVNLAGVPPSTTLENLEETHRMYQQKVKAFKIDSNV